MGGGNSVTNISENLNTSIVSAITNIAQRSTQNVVQTQSFNIDCTKIDKINADSYIKCLNIMSPHLGLYTSEEVANLCSKDKASCGGNNVDISQAISIQQMSTVISKSQADLQQQMLNQLKQTATGTYGAFSFGDETTNKMMTVSKEAAYAIVNSKQKILQELAEQQSFTLKGNIQALTLSQTNNIIQQALQGSSSYTKSLQDLSTYMTQTAKSKDGLSSGMFKILMIVIAVIIGVLVLLGVVIWVVKKFKKKPGTSDSSQTSEQTTEIHREEELQEIPHRYIDSETAIV